MIKKIKVKNPFEVGKIYTPKKDYVMNFGYPSNKHIAYIKDKSYLCENFGCLSDEWHDANHQMIGEEKYFLEVIELEIENIKI